MAHKLANLRQTERQTYNTQENFAELFEKSFSKIKEGAVIKGIVTAVKDDHVIVDVGLKTEGKIPLREFGTFGEKPTFEAGEEIEVYLERIENKNGEAVLSRERAIREESWGLFEKMHQEKTHVDGVIFGKVKGGFTVDLNGTVAFLPGSQVDVRPIKDISPLMGIVQPFVILKMDKKRGNIVVSRRAILEESRSEARQEMLSNIEEGVVLDGTVKNITDYGAFIDLGSIDGLLHITDISWKRVNHPSEVLRLGQTIKVKVIKYDKENHRVSLGIKQLEDSPWNDIETRFPVGTRFTGNITNITDYGAFVELEPGIEGLVHVSELSWTKKNVHPSKVVAQGQKVEVMVLDIDSIKHRISLGLKQCKENPWQIFAEKHAIGSVIDGEIKNIADFGLFVGFEDGVDGLVHVSDLSWNDNNEELIKNYNKGDIIKIMVLAVDPDKERISVGLKQMDSDPFESAIGGLAKGQTVTVSVSAAREDGIEVVLPGNHITSFIKKADLSRDRADQRPERFAVGDRVDVKVTGIDKAARKISLSIKALEIDEQKKAIEEYGSADSGASLGDILGVALSKSKEQGNKKSESEE